MHYFKGTSKGTQKELKGNSKGTSKGTQKGPQRELKRELKGNSEGTQRKLKRELKRELKRQLKGNSKGNLKGAQKGTQRELRGNSKETLLLIWFQENEYFGKNCKIGCAWFSHLLKWLTDIMIKQQFFHVHKSKNTFSWKHEKNELGKKRSFPTVPHLFRELLLMPTGGNHMTY